MLILWEFMELHLTSNIEVDSLAVSHCAIIVNSERILNIERNIFTKQNT